MTAPVQLYSDYTPGPARRYRIPVIVSRLGLGTQVGIVPVVVGQVDANRVADLIDAFWQDKSTAVIVVVISYAPVSNDYSNQSEKQTGVPIPSHSSIRRANGRDAGRQNSPVAPIVQPLCSSSPADRR